MVMKRLLLIISSILALTFISSCNNDEADVRGKYPILFGSADSRGVANIDNLKTDGFKVYAYFQGNTGNSATFEKDVTYNSQSDVWFYEGIQYWIPGTAYWFKAFYPTVLTAGTLAVDNSTWAQSFKITGFSIAEQEDVMVSNQEIASGVTSDGVPTWPDASNSVGSIVNLKFNHLLACVVVEIKCEVSNVSISSIKLSNIADNATCENGVWSSNNTGSVTYTPTDVTLDSTQFVDVTAGGILVVPEDVNGQQTIQITASHKTYDAVSIPATTWENGKKYTYRATIKQNDIIFNDAPEVDEWDSDSATGSVIIK